MLVFIALQSAVQGGAFDLEALAKDDQPGFQLNRRCSAPASEGAIVVCGSRHGDERFRLPPSTASSEPGARHRGDAPSTMAGITPAAPCGIFEGQRRCSKKEAEAYGYGGGRDPITVAGKVLGAVLDPDD